VAGSDGSTLDLEPVDLLWDAPEVTPVAGDAVYKSGQKGAIVEFFGWPHTEVAKECAFLADAGYMGAKLFPVQEQVMSLQTYEGACRRRPRPLDVLIFAVVSHDDR
jgi:alpha-amylase